jgi:RNA polymerase sigma-70 factor (ECF subfamily)
VRAAKTPVVGRVTKFVASVSSHFWTGVTLRWIEANDRASVILSRNGAVAALAAICAATQGIDQIFWVMRPGKLVSISLSLQATQERASLADQLS